MDPNAIYEQAVKTKEASARRFIIKVYAWMMLALIITGISGLSVISNPVLSEMVSNSNIVFFGLIIAEVILVIYLTRKLYEMTPAMAKFWFFVYSVLNGVTLSALLYVYDLGTVGYAFLVTAVLFGVMSLYGYITKTDLTSIGNLLVMGLFGLIIATVFNMFFRNDQLSLILTYIGVFIFIGLIGYDTQKIKQLGYNSSSSEEANASIMGAMILYLDFINLFIRLVRLIGRK